MPRLSRRALCAALLLAPSGAAFGAPPTPGPDERAITAVFESARKALEDRKGAAAVELLSRDSVRRLEGVRQAAISGMASKLDPLPAADRFAALGLRRYVSPAELRRKSLGQLADHGLKEGWLGPNIIRRAALGAIRVAGDRATALLLVDHKPSVVQADFVREGAVWRIDLASVLHVGSTFIKGFAAINGKTEAQYIDELLAKLPAKPALTPTR